MLFWLAAAATVAHPSSAHSNDHVRPAVAEARATVRIVSGVRLRLGPDEGKQTESGDVPHPHNAVVMADGAAMPARLIEFE